MDKAISIQLGDQSITVTDPTVVGYATSNGLDSIKDALVCGVAAMQAATSNTQALSLEKRLSEVQSTLEARLTKSTQGVIDILRDASDPQKNGSLANRVGSSLEEQALRILSSIDPAKPGSLYSQVLEELRRTSRGGVDDDRVRELESKLPSKGRNFEESVIAALSVSSAPFHDCVEGTGDSVGIGSSKKGDVIVTCSHPAPRSIVVEAKRRRVSLTPRFIETELRAAISNRGANAAILVVHPEFRDCVGANLKILAKNIIACVYDPDGGDSTALDVAYFLARASAYTGSESSGSVDSVRVSRRLEELASRVEQMSVSERSMAQSIDDLDKCREGFSTSRRALLREIQNLCLEVNGSLQDEKPAVGAFIVEGSQPDAPNTPALPPSGSKKLTF
jgi:hypothetical protein